MHRVAARRTPGSRDAAPCARASTAPRRSRWSASARRTFGGGGGGGVPRMFSRIHLPRTTGEVRSGYDVTVRMLPWPSSPPRTLSGSRVTRRKWLPRDVRIAVVPRQPLVQEGVVGAQQSSALRSSRTMLSKNSSVSRAERLPQAVVEVREVALRPVRSAAGCAGTATARRSSSRARRTRGSAIIRRTCCVEHGRRSCSCPSTATSSSSSSGMLLHRKNDSRDASSRSLIAVGGAGVALAGSTLDAEQELGADQQALERTLDRRPRIRPAPALRRRAPAAARCPRRSPAGDRRGAPASRGSSSRTRPHPRVPRSPSAPPRVQPAAGRRRCAGGSAYPPATPGVCGPLISTLRSARAHARSRARCCRPGTGAGTAGAPSRPSPTSS